MNHKVLFERLDERFLTVLLMCMVEIVYFKELKGTFLWSFANETKDKQRSSYD